MDLLAALKISHEDELLPTPAAFPEPGPVVERWQLADFIEQRGDGDQWLVHAAGGVGKTVSVQSLATRLPAGKRDAATLCSQKAFHKPFHLASAHNDLDHLRLPGRPSRLHSLSGYEAT